jgi:polar amino acid transport system substrate-binding protein
MVIVGEEFPPFEFIKDDKAVGFDIDIVKHIFKNMNIPVKFQILPWKRAWKMVETGKADAVLSTSRKMNREPYVWYPKEDMWVSEYVFFVRRDKMQKNFEGYKTAVQQKLQIGIIQGNSYHPTFWHAFPYKNGATTFQGETVRGLNNQLQGAITLKQNIKKLAARRFDLFISDKILGTYTARLLGLQDQITYYDLVLYSKPYPMPFVKRSSYPNIKQIANEFEKKLKIFKKSKEYQNIVKNWLN